jgi:hypothetical protein
MGARRGRAACAACAGLLAVTSARPALAFERQQHVGADLGGAVLSTNGGSSKFGGSAGLHYTYGVLDSLNLVFEVAAFGFGIDARPAKGAPPPEPGVVATAAGGAMYILDVLRWVPYGGVLLGAAYATGGLLDQGFGTLDVQLALGVDYQLSRSWTVGVTYRQHMFVAKMTDYPEFTALGLRFEYTWGW